MLVVSTPNHSTKRSAPVISWGLPVLIGLFTVLPAAATTINWGLFQGQLGVQAGLEYTDNLNNSESNRVSNVYWLLGPTFDGGITLPIHIAGTGGEELRLSTAFSYNEKYSLNGNKNTRTFSSPITANLHIPLRIGEWRISVFDKFAFKNDSLEDAVALDQPNSEQYQNLAGMNATRNFGLASLSLGAQRTDRIFPDEPDSETTVYEFSFTPAIQLRQHYTLFWANTYGITYQADPQLQDSEGYSSSIGISGQLTPYLNGSLSVGYAHSHIHALKLGPGGGIFGGIYDPEVRKADNVDGITSSIALSYAHPLNPYTTYAISMFNSPGVTAFSKSSSITEVYGVTLVVNHRLTERVTISPSFQWIHSQSVGSQTVKDRVDIFSAQLSLQRAITQNLKFTLDYIYLSRFSNQPGSTYDVNRLTVRLNYVF